MGEAPAPDSGPLVPVESFEVPWFEGISAVACGMVTCQSDV